jgi:hypothetical protein
LEGLFKMGMSVRCDSPIFETPLHSIFFHFSSSYPQCVCIG